MEENIWKSHIDLGTNAQAIDQWFLEQKKQQDSLVGFF